MKFKLIIAFLPDAHLEDVLTAARAAGATGSTVITSARGEGLEPERRFLGLELASHRNLAFWLVEEHVAPVVLRRIAAVGRFEEERGAGIACQIDVEDAVGLLRQMQALEKGRNPSGD
jgi:hypothetical protein